MLTNPSDCKLLVNFLLIRWKQMIGLASLERVHVASCLNALDNNLPIPEMPVILVAMPCKQIEIIKNRIIAILPEASFIDYEYEAPAPLDPNDFIEVFEADHNQCINKVEDVMKKMQIQ